MTIYYKAFDRNLKCRDFQYKEGETYEIEGPSVLCERGFHFCKALVLTLEYYPVNNCITENRYAEIEVLGDLNWEDVIKHKGCTNRIKIVRVIPDEEVKALVDGDSNSGYSNSGNRNSGDRNSGDRNSGDSNSGDSNSGNRNSGSWNSCDRDSGFFNSEQSKTIRAFNRSCSLEDWDSADIPYFLHFELFEGKTYKESFQAAYDKASSDDKKLLLALPNFDADVFYEISGIRV